MNNLIYIALPKISCFCSAFWVVSLLLLRLEKKRKIEPRKILSPRQQFPMLDAIDDSVSFTWFYLFEIRFHHFIKILDHFILSLIIYYKEENVDT